MKEHNLDSWHEFQGEIGKLIANQKDKEQKGTHYSDLLFRGQTNASWALETTLERWAGTDILLLRHFADLSLIHEEVESLTSQRWEIPTYSGFEEELSSDVLRYPIPGQLYEFLVYLRHHGFPSPLLDWTVSPYIAAYFAFRTAKPNRPVAIYAYQEYAGRGKGGWAEDPRICHLGRHVRTHPRHYLQQSQYTVSIEGNREELKYCPHERAFEASLFKKQDLLWKFTLPSELRAEVLRYLHLHNMTAYSLLGSEEALMESLAIQRFVLNS